MPEVRNVYPVFNKEESLLCIFADIENAKLFKEAYNKKHNADAFFASWMIGDKFIDEWLKELNGNE